MSRSFVALLVLALVALSFGSMTSVSAKSNNKPRVTCRNPKKNYHIEDGASIGYGDSSSPKACRKSCQKKNKNGYLVCGSYEFGASQHGSGCQLFAPGAVLSKGSDCSFQGSCTKYANVCGDNEPILY